MLSLKNKMKETNQILTGDKWTDTRLSNLHPMLIGQASSIFAKANKLRPDVVYRATSTYRSPEEQDVLYAKGRTSSGSIVTNAKKYQSYHNYGLAFDIVPLRKGVAIWNEPQLFEDFAKIAERSGWYWGGNFKTLKDLPHFEKTFGKKPSQFFNIVKMYGTKYPRIV